MENKEKVLVVLLAVALIVVVFNQIQLFSAKSGGIASKLPTGMTVASASIMPTGSPKIYGKELGVSYDDVTANNPSSTENTITILGNLDRTIKLEGNDLERYKKIASQISCEYCCGAPAIIFSTGQPACGCAHSYAMRGIAKYLITKHGSEFSDDEILSEMAKWKTLFFPGVMQSKADVLKQKGMEFNYASLGSNKYRGIEKGASAGGNMVGGC